MRILVLAPHPYYLVRGTPIDLDLVLRVLSARPDVEIDVVVYSEGEERTYANVRFHRTPNLPFLRTTRPGFSLRKLLCDVFLFFKAWSLMRQPYDVIHAGEEAVFMAQFFRWIYKIPYLYDLDSSVAQQMVEKYRLLKIFAPLFNRMEASAIRGALFNLPVCNALSDLCRERGASHVVTLHDISQLKNPYAPQTGNLKREIDIDRLIMLYVGNLEPYQGVDLLLEGFAIAAGRTDAIDLVIVGGTPTDIQNYRAKAESLKVGNRTHFLGPRPIEDLDGILADADILVAPRIRGLNTPMKVFPYLHSGRAVLVTDLPTHSQILSPDVAMLAKPTPTAFADAIVTLTHNSALRQQLGERGRAFVEGNHTFKWHAERLNQVYDRVEAHLSRS
jgi:glycosyltransferase involved in cell wall biosynthesis